MKGVDELVRRVDLLPGRVVVIYLHAMEGHTTRFASSLLFPIFGGSTSESGTGGRLRRLGSGYTNVWHGMDGVEQMLTTSITPMACWSMTTLSTSA